MALNTQRGRILGAQRAEREAWPAWRRIVQAAAFPLFPLLQLRHVLPQMQRVPVPAAMRTRVVLGLVGTLGVLAVGEAWGLIAGSGDAVSRLEDFELNRARHLTRSDREALAPLPSVG